MKNHNAKKMSPTRKGRLAVYVDPTGDDKQSVIGGAWGGWPIFITTMALLFLTCCGENRTTEVDRHDSLYKAYQVEVEHRNRLLLTGASLKNYVEDIRVGDAHSIKRTKEELDKLTEEYEAELVAIGRDKMTEKQEQVRSKAAALDAFAGQVAIASHGERCGSDGCSGNCGFCSYDQVCFKLICRCIPQCKDKQCGSDGCGGVCGTGSCKTDLRCSEDGKCVVRGTEKICNPTCKKLPTGPLDKVLSTKDYSASPKSSYTSENISSIELLEEYLNIVKTKADDVSRKVSSISQITGDSQQFKEEIELLETELKSLKSQIKTLTKDVRARKKKLRRAKKAARVTMEEELNIKNQELEAIKLKKKEVRQSLKDKRDTTGEYNKILQKFKRNSGEIDNAQIVFANEVKRLEQIREDWIAAEESLKVAKSELDEVKQEFDGPKNKLEKRYKSRSKEQNIELKLLSKRAFTSDELPIWGDNSGLSRTSRWVLAGINDKRLISFKTGIHALYYKRQKVLSELSDDVDKGERLKITKEVEILEAFHILLTELMASNERLLALEKAMENERKKMAE